MLVTISLHKISKTWVWFYFISIMWYFFGDILVLTWFLFMFIVWFWKIIMNNILWRMWQVKFKSVIFLGGGDSIAEGSTTAVGQRKSSEILFHTNCKRNRSWDCINFVTYSQNIQNSGFKVRSYYKSSLKLFLPLKPPEEVKSLNRWLILPFITNKW